MTTKQVMTGVGLVMLAGGVVALIISIGPCHEGHWERKYQPAWTEFRHIQTGKTTSVTLPIFHPESCGTNWICDVRCKKLPAHSKHQKVDWGLLLTDPPCERLDKR